MMFNLMVTDEINCVQSSKLTKRCQSCAVGLFRCLFYSCEDEPDPDELQYDLALLLSTT